MYASNEEEDWVYLHKTPPVITISQPIVNHQSSGSSKSDLSSTELEHAQNDFNNPHDLERENRLLEMPLLFSQAENDHQLLPFQTSTIEEKEFIIPDENSTIETPATMNENDVLNTGFEVKEVIQSVSQEIKLRKCVEQYHNKNNRLVSCTCLIVLLTLSFIFGRIVTPWDQPTMNQIAKELVKTNQRLNEIGDIPIGNFEEKLTKQIDEKLQNMLDQQMTWYEHERSVFISQIHGLRQILKKTQQNFTNTIHHLNSENERLQEQIKSLEQRLEVPEEQYSTTRHKGVNCTKSLRLSLNKLVTNLFKRTASVNLSSLFEHLSASVSNIVDHRHEYIKASKRKLTDLTRLSPTEKFRQSINNLSSSFRKAKSTYTSWMKSRGVISNVPKKFPWRWTFSRGYHRGRMYFPSPDKEQVCSSKFYFPMNKICSMKNWMGKLFRF